MNGRTRPLLGGFVCLLVLLGTAFGADAYRAPAPGDPCALTDWRWLAREPVGSRAVLSDPWGERKLEKVEGGWLVAQLEGPGVLEHFWTSNADAVLSVEVDGQKLWQARLRDYLDAQAKSPDAPCLFPKPLMFGEGGMVHLLAPVGFNRSLRLVTDREALRHYVSYRQFPAGTQVLAAGAALDGQYAKALKAAADVWKQGAFGFGVDGIAGARQVIGDFTLDARRRCTVLAVPGGGEITHLEFHMNPSLTGSLREVVAEFFYDGAAEPCVRLPITDLAGLPHPWSEGRWDSYSGTLAGGLRYPWYVNEPRVLYPEATFYLNLPVPFARQMRLDLVNRSNSVRFVGSVRATVAPLAGGDTPKVGRLCGTRVLKPISPGAAPLPLLDVPGRGQLVGLGLFLTGNELVMPPAVRNSIIRLTLDGDRQIAGHGLLPLWFQGIYGGPILGQPIWNHPRYGHNYCGVMRHFITDPVPFERGAQFAFTVGPDGTGAPDKATVLALWYDFSDAPYMAPPLAERAEELPYSRCGQWIGGSRLGPGDKDPQVFWSVEAEDLAPMLRVHDGEVVAVEDAEHDYHPSMGKFLQVTAYATGSYADCTVRLPHTRYLAVATNALWGPKRGAFEFDVLSTQQARQGPQFELGDAYYLGRLLGWGPMEAPVFVGDSLRHRRDPGTMFSVPFLNPAPDDEGVLRFICRSIGPGNLLKLDEVGIVMPPAAENGWHEFEEGPTAETAGGLRAQQPKHGSFKWSGWGALVLSSPKGGKASVQALVPTGAAKPAEVLIRGSLGPKQGRWEVRVAGGAAVPLSPGKDEEQVVEWRVPVAGVSLPGPIAMEFTCTEAGEKPERALTAPDARIVLDAWTVK